MQFLCSYAHDEPCLCIVLYHCNAESIHVQGSAKEIENRHNDIDRSFVNSMNFSARVIKHFLIYLDIMFNLMFVILLYVTLV